MLPHYETRSSRSASHSSRSASCSSRSVPRLHASKHASMQSTLTCIQTKIKDWKLFDSCLSLHLNEGKILETPMLICCVLSWAFIYFRVFIWSELYSCTQATWSFLWGFICVGPKSKITLFLEHGFCEFHAILCESAYDKLPRDFSGIYTDTLSQPSKWWLTMTAGW